MKRYKCLSDSYANFVVGGVYDENHENRSGKNISYFAKCYPEDWEPMPSFPRVMIVGDDDYGDVERTVLWIDPNPNASNPVIAITDGDSVNTPGYSTTRWMYAREKLSNKLDISITVNGEPLHISQKLISVLKQSF